MNDGLLPFLVGGELGRNNTSEATAVAAPHDAHGYQNEIDDQKRSNYAWKAHREGNY